MESNEYVLEPQITTSTIIALTEYVTDLEKGNTSTAIVLDFSKAFDCLDHTQ
jgi:anti-anti-sigma regulatory factor